MDKNTVWAIVLSTVVILGWMFYQSVIMPPVEETAITETPIAVLDESVAVQNDSNQDNQLQTQLEQEEILIEEHFVISTEFVDITLTNRGGDIIGYQLKEHLVGSNGVEMAENITDNNRALALSLGTNDNAIINDIFQVELIDDYTIGFSKTYTTSTAGQTEYYSIKKLYTFDPSEYLFKLDIRFEGDGYEKRASSDVAYTLRSSPQIGPYYDPGVDRYEHRTFYSYDGKARDKRLGEGDIEVYDDTFNWVGVAGKYFTQQIVTTDSSTIKDAIYSTVGQVDDFYNAQVSIERKSTNQDSIQDTYYVYMGPKVDNTMVMYNDAEENNWGLSNLRIDEILSSGWLAWLEAILKFLMEIFYSIIPNWGVSIILMTIVLKIGMYPLTKKSSMATLRMQELQPQIKDIQDKYKGNPEKLNTEMAKFYKEAGYNPMSGCLPLLIQFPLIFAMFGLFNNYFEFRGAMFIPGWIPDLSISDSVGVFPEGIPFIGGMTISVLPVIYVASQLLFTKITQSTATAASNSQMKMMMYLMPLIFFFMFYTAPAGLLLYWTVSNFLQLVQQLTINKIMHAKRKEMGIAEPKKEVALPPSAKKRKKN